MFRNGLLIGVALLVGVVGWNARGQTSATASLINQQLDKQVKLQLSGSLPEVMGQIAKQTGVPLDAQAAVWDVLPWGRDTVMNAKVENQTLREALDQITKKLGLVFVLKDEAVELQPMPALIRLGRKSTVSEVDALYTLSITPLDLKTDKPKFKELAEAIDLKLEAIKSPFAIENRTATSPDKVSQDAVVAVPRNATLAEALEAMDTQSAATWYPWGKSIVLLAKQDQIRRSLQKEVTLRHEGTDVGQVLTELSARSGVKFVYAPGSLQEVAPQSRNIRLVLSATVMDALEAVSGLTGLGYVVKDNEVYIWNTQSTAAGPRDKTVAFLPTETGLTILITESQCPADVKEFIEYQKKKQYESIRKMMVEQGFKAKASTQPATRPVGAGGKDL